MTDLEALAKLAQDAVERPPDNRDEWKSGRDAIKAFESELDLATEVALVRVAQAARELALCMPDEANGVLATGLPTEGAVADLRAALADLDRCGPRRHGCNLSLVAPLAG